MLRPWDLSIGYCQPDFDRSTNVKDFMQPREWWDYWNIVHHVTLPELIQASFVPFGHPSSTLEWQYFWDAVPY